jgi:hypothetical protein
METILSLAGFVCVYAAMFVSCLRDGNSVVKHDGRHCEIDFD